VAATQPTQKLINGQNLSAFANVRAIVARRQLIFKASYSFDGRIRIRRDGETTGGAFRNSYSAGGYILTTHYRVWVSGG